MNELAAFFRVIGFFVLVGLAAALCLVIVAVWVVVLLAYALLRGGDWVSARLRR